MRKISDILIDPHNTPENLLKAAEQSLIKGYKEYTISEYQDSNGEIKPLMVRIKHPDQDADLAISDAYTRKYNELLKDPNYMTWQEMKECLAKRGVWTEKDENDYYDSDIKLRDATIKFNTLAIKNNLDKKGRAKKEQELFEKYREEYDKIDQEITALNMKRYGFFHNSIEGQAQEYAGYYKFIYCVLIERDGNWVKLWETLENFRNETAFNRKKITELSSVAYSFWAGIDQGVLYDLPSQLTGEDAKDDSEKS